MNTHPIEVHNIGGSYTGHFRLIWDTRTLHTVCDDDGNAVRFRDARDARIAAFEARDAAEEGRFTHWRGVPQVTPCPKVWEARSAAGRKKWAQERFKNMCKEAAE